MEIKPQQDVISHGLEWQKLESLIIPRVCKDVKWEFLIQ